LLASINVVPSKRQLDAIKSREGKMEDKDKLIEALRALSECDDEDLKARAAKALAAMTDEEPAAEDPPDPPAKEEAPPAAASTAGAMAVVAQSALDRIAVLEARAEASERAGLLAARPDIDVSLRAVLATSPVSEVRKILGALKRVTLKPAASAVVAPTRGEAQGQSGARLMPDAKLALDARMGLARVTHGAVATDHKLTLGAMTVAAMNGGSNG
jgi:hypothetical protein